MPYVDASTGSSVGSSGLTKEDEENLFRGVLTLLDAENPAEAQLVRDRFDCIASFEETVSRYPLIRESQVLKGQLRDEQLLVKSLIGLSPSSHLLHIPARILAMRSYLVTKFHVYSLLCKILPETSELGLQARRYVFSIMFTIMAEDVYFSCLEETAFPEDIKVHLADDLISLWDSGAELALAKHFPALEALWAARNDSPPSFGTMEGTSEIFRLSIDLGNDWHDFLLFLVNDDEARWALDEFLFGLSYEELSSVRSRLKRFGISAVDFGEIRSYLGSESAYSVVKNPDPRAIYDFYIDRKEAALFRKRMNARGPHKTLEEIYLKYRALTI